MFDDYDEEMGFLSPRHAADTSLESVSIEAERDGFYDLEDHRPREDHMLNIADTPERGRNPLTDWRTVSRWRVVGRDGGRLARRQDAETQF
ncbi:hypothetical protein PR003_g9526 [Phytophthora rubi]|uniref:Uncharacterized protein n=1 Tax=Phytophthora rubi TaxID=129364 RepID=A0A6A3MIS4_9STRA|nr:hypothetical protein PR002_g9654 [Phytophthora rubi]KAE9342337.1 hypothetical protein PR003_g9526 [Phytophthora rubi]